LIKHDDNSVQYTCLNPPVADYQKGDRMFSMRATNFITSIYSSGNAFQNYYFSNPKIFGIMSFFAILSIMAITDRVNIQIDPGTEDEVSQKDKLKDNFELKSR